LLSDDRLITITGRDVFLDPVDCCFEICARPIGFNSDLALVTACRLFIRRRQFPIKLPFNFSSFGDRVLVQIPQSLSISSGFINENYRGDFHLQSHPIECDNVPEEHPDCFVAGRLVAINGKDRLEPTRSIVREVTDRTSCQRR